MLIQKKIIKNTKILIFLISIVISSCAVNEKEPFDIINEAKKLFNNIAGESEDIVVNKRQKEVSDQKKPEILQSKKLHDKKEKNNEKKETDKVSPIIRKSEKIVFRKE